MRTDEEFRAEVYRRGNLRIQKERARYKKIKVSISLCAALFCCVLSVWIVGPMLSINDSTPEGMHYNDIDVTPENVVEEDGISNEDDFIEEGLEGIVHETITVSISKNDGTEECSKDIYDVMKINYFKDVIYEIEKQEYYDEILTNQENGTILETETNQENITEDIMVYTFIAKGNDGADTKYILKGNILYVLETNKEYKLNQIEKEKILSIIE